MNEELIDEHSTPENPEGESEEALENRAYKGSLIIDATCAPSKVRYPTDTSLLNEAREKSELIIDQLHVKGQQKPRTYRKKAAKAYKLFARKRKPRKNEIRQAIRTQLGYVKRNLNSIAVMLAQGAELSASMISTLETIRQVYEQQYEMYTKKKHQVKDRIVSLQQPWLRPIVRGKANKTIEIGAKFDASVDEHNFTRLEYYSFDAYNESTKLQEILEAYHQRTGYYPERVLVDQIYPTRANRAYCKERGIHLSARALGRPQQDETQAKALKKQYYLDQCERVEVERAFSQLKRKCGIGLITRKLKETTLHTIALSIFVQNLKKILCSLIDWATNPVFFASLMRNRHAVALTQLCMLISWISFA